MRISSQLYGGNGGGEFSDTDWTGRIKRILVRSGDRIDKITVWYGLAVGGEEMREHGGTGGHDNPEIVLAPDERICGVVVRSGDAVDSLLFVTYRGGNLATLRRYGPYGGRGGEEHVIFCDNLVAIYGRSGAALDAIGFISENSMCSA